MEFDQKLFENAFKFAPIGMALVSLEGKFLKVNQSICEFWGYSETELLKIDFQTITYPEDLNRDLGSLKQLSQGEILTYRMEKRYFHKSGNIIWALLSVSVIRDATGAPSFYISQVMDISEVKKAQQSLIQNSKMVSLGEMAAGLAHEINNPLTIISLNTSSIEEELKVKNPNLPMVENFLKRIDVTVKRINEVVISLRKLSFHSESLSIEKSQIEQIINDSLALGREKFKASGITIIKKIEDVEVECHSVEISQVLVNLLNNSYYALETCTEKIVTIESYVANDHVIISISDTGKGIPEDIRSKIMDPFFTTKPLGIGTGLGLSISRNIIEFHSGKFYLDENSARTRFVVELPLVHI